MIGEGFGEHNKDAEKESSKVSPNQNPNNSSNTNTSTFSDFVNVNFFVNSFPKHLYAHSKTTVWYNNQTHKRT